eukprot:GHVL01032139.1.p1 GENE.GHVL01032139.1~~GHVL01032139.1.p1  ORF type:complete len:820 (+),score=239.46 GHVL01032139.1:110-2569(+)
MSRVIRFFIIFLLTPVRLYNLRFLKIRSRIPIRSQMPNIPEEDLTPIIPPSGPSEYGGGERARVEVLPNPDELQLDIVESKTNCTAMVSALFSPKATREIWDTSINEMVTRHKRGTNIPIQSEHARKKVAVTLCAERSIKAFILRRPGTRIASNPTMIGGKQQLEHLFEPGAPFFLKLSCEVVPYPEFLEDFNQMHVTVFLTPKGEEDRRMTTRINELLDEYRILKPKYSKVEWGDCISAKIDRVYSKLLDGSMGGPLPEKYQFPTGEESCGSYKTVFKIRNCQTRLHCSTNDKQIISTDDNFFIPYNYLINNTLDNDDILLSDDDESTNSTSVITRFAPSPTGDLHFGGARTALYNYLFAKNQNGKFYLRIEDTDKKRNIEGCEDRIINDLNWLNIKWDKIYKQSNRYNIYIKYINILLKNDDAFYCFCEGDDYRCRYLSKDIIYNNIYKKIPYTIRIKNYVKKYSYIDEIYGKIVNNEIKDSIIWRSNGTPVYNFCCPLDDYLLNITHIIRSREHILNTIKHIMLWEKLNKIKKKNIPIYAHTSYIVDKDNKKLSKRNNNNNSHIFTLKSNNYLSDSVKNMLLLTGWNDGSETEIYNENDMINKFNIKRIVKSSSFFDIKKLDWLNSKYYENISDDIFLDMIKKRFYEINIINEYNEIFENIIKIISLSIRSGGVTVETVLNEILDTFNYNIGKCIIDIQLNYDENYQDFRMIGELLYKKIDIKMLKLNINDIYDIDKLIKYYDNFYNALIYELINTTNIKKKKCMYYSRIWLTGKTKGSSVSKKLLVLASSELVNLNIKSVKLSERLKLIELYTRA